MKGSGSAVPKVSLTSVVETINTLPKDRKQLSVWAENTACHVRCVRVEEGKGQSRQLSPEEGKGQPRQLSPVPVSVTVALNLHVRSQQQKQQHN